MSRSTRPRRPAAALLAALAITVIAVGPALADASLVETSPADGATIDGTPDEIVATFDQALGDDSRLVLRSADGTDLATGGLDADDATRLVIDEVPDIEPGEYEVRWTAASEDGHILRDSWTFTVTAVPTPTPTVAPTAAPTEAPSDAPSAAPTDAPSVAPTEAPSEPPGDGDPAASTGDVLLPIAAGLALVAVAAGVLLSRRRRA